MEIRPEKGLGSLLLGSSIWEILNLITSPNERFGKCVTRFNSEDPMKMHIILDLENLGILLYFDPKSQLLVLIKIYELSRVQLSYKKIPINAPSLFSLAQTHSVFGPTIAGHYTEDKAKYILQYPGTTFSFRVDSREVIKNQAPDPNTTFLQCFYIFEPDSKDSSKIETNSKSQIVIVHPSEGIEIDNSFILYGDSPQRVKSLLGKTEAVSVKNTNRNIYRRSDKDDEEFEFDYFFTYFSLGIDVLFSAETHTVIKFILHTNFPNCPHFKLYSKCQYRIKSEVETDVFGNDSDQMYVTPNMKWDKIQSIYGKCEHQPLVSSSSNRPSYQTNLFPYKNLIFEVMENEYVSSVTMIM